jgi:ABC-2 type transport system ATP-binding protein
MITTKRLSKHFKETIAVDDLTLDIPRGEVFGFLGPNGAGKTTTIRMLTGLIAPTNGEAEVAKCVVGEQDSKLRKKVGILTETPGLYDRLSAERNLAFFGELYEVQGLASQVEHYLRMLGLWGRRGEEVGTFSKGMRQKLAIARALLHEPEVLFLDEPTSGLDPEAARMVRDFIGDLKVEGRTIFLCTHNLTEADQLCDRVAVIDSRLLALDSPAQLRRQVFGRMVVFHLKEIEPNYLTAVKRFPFVQSAEDVEGKLLITLDDPEEQNPLLLRALLEEGAAVQFVGELRRSLEDVYLQLVRRDSDEGEVEVEGEG